MVSHLRGDDLVSGISESGDFFHFAASTCRWMEEGLSWKQATGMGHSADSSIWFEKLSFLSLWADFQFVTRLPTEACPLLEDKRKPVDFSEWQFQCSGLTNARELLLCSPLSIILCTGLPKGSMTFTDIFLVPSQDMATQKRSSSMRGSLTHFIISIFVM